ncbi:MAG: SPASM domain-containing protein [Candidatus Aminicenantes bacterium]|nr:SPASM domain-containing protein [Candidatus Aminicenantes bacterium]
MKVSKYNFFAHTSDGERIAFNGISCSLAKIDDDHFNEYKLIESGEENKSRLSDEKKRKIHQALLKGGFIYPADSLDEIEGISFGYNKSKYADGLLNLTIAPTMDCNFNCYYCYEKWKKQRDKTYMNRDTENGLIKFADLFLANKRKLSVSWYGGEPLLALDSIYRLSESFIKLCEKKKCGYDSDIITNGYHLKPEVVDNLIKYKVRSAQITIDGPKDIHDSRRYDIEKGESFETIMENIAYAKKFMNVIIRINVDKKNSHRVEEFLDYLVGSNLTENIGVYMGRVYDCKQDPLSKHHNLLYESKEFFQKRKEILSKAILEKKLGWIGPYPSPLVLPCGAVNINTFVIASDGYVYKCWEVIGEKEEAVFHVSKPEIINKKLLKWVNWDPKDNEECRECKFLPLCNGGCVVTAMKGKNRCSYWKDNLSDMLGILAYKHEHLVGKRNA